jgi:hypothetical protein
MTVLDRWEAWHKDAVIFRANGCVYTEIDWRDVRSEDDWARLIRERIPPLIGLAMPVHDAPALHGEQRDA